MFRTSLTKVWVPAQRQVFKLANGYPHLHQSGILEVTKPICHPKFHEVLLIACRCFSKRSLIDDLEGLQEASQEDEFDDKQVPLTRKKGLQKSSFQGDSVNYDTFLDIMSVILDSTGSSPHGTGAKGISTGLDNIMSGLVQLVKENPSLADNLLDFENALNKAEVAQKNLESVLQEIQTANDKVMLVEKLLKSSDFDKSSVVVRNLGFKVRDTKANLGKRVMDIRFSMSKQERVLNEIIQKSLISYQSEDIPNYSVITEPTIPNTGINNMKPKKKGIDPVKDLAQINKDQIEKVTKKQKSVDEQDVKPKKSVKQETTAMDKIDDEEQPKESDTRSALSTLEEHFGLSDKMNKQSRKVKSPTVKDPSGDLNFILKKSIDNLNKPPDPREPAKKSRSTTQSENEDFSNFLKKELKLQASSVDKKPDLKLSREQMSEEEDHGIYHTEKELMDLFKGEKAVDPEGIQEEAMGPAETEMDDLWSQITPLDDVPQGETKKARKKRLKKLEAMDSTETEMDDPWLQITPMEDVPPAETKKAKKNRLQQVSQHTDESSKGKAVKNVPSLEDLW